MRSSGYYVVNDSKPVKQKSSLPDSGPTGPVLLTKMATTRGMDIAADEVFREDKTPYRSAVTRLFSCIYALVIIVLGIVLATANVLTGRERIHYYYLEAFQIYLYLLSLVFLLYVQGCLLWGIKTSRYEVNIRYSFRRSKSGSPERDTEEKLTDIEKIRECSPFPDDSLRGPLTLPAEGTVAHVGDGINFYLRLGAIAFSIGTVILDGFQISSYFENGLSDRCRSHIFLVVYCLHIVFVFVQTFFVFKNHRLLINKHKAMVRFGLMHLVATNICVWIISTVSEASDSYRQQDYHYRVNSTVDQSTTQQPDVITTPIYGSCYAAITLARLASPYLFPCVIQYCLIAAGILFHMYQNVGVTIKQRWPSHASFTSSVPAGTTNVDCDKANKGLFLGLLIGVVTVIAIATFFVFNARLTDTGTAIKIFYITEISLLTITLFGVIFGYCRLTRLKFTESRDISLQGFLLIIALFGTYVYYCFVVLAIAFNFWSYGLIGILALACTAVALIEITIQAAFIFDGLRRCSGCEAHMANKPGRAIVTFLLVCNLALSAVYVFEVTKTTVAPIHRTFYGILAWNVITHICHPLIIFFRFHSSVCFSDIWFLPYQREKAT